MRNGVVIYALTGFVTTGLIVAAGFAWRQPTSDSLATTASAVPQLRAPASPRTITRRNHSAAKAAVVDNANVAIGSLPQSYNVLLTHSLFSAKPTASADPSAPAEGEFTLRGVMQRGRRCFAYIENTTSHQSQELRVGDVIGLGKLVAIDLDGVRYAGAGRDFRVEVGQSFNGARNVATAQSMTTLRQVTE